MVIFSLFLPLLNLSALKTPCGSQFAFSTQEIKPNFLVTPSPTQHHSFFRKVPTLFSNHADGIWLTYIFLTVAVTSARLLKRPSWLSKRPSWLSKRPSWLSNVLHRQQFFDEFLSPSLHSSYPVFIISTELSLLKVDAYISSPLSTLTGPFILIFSMNLLQFSFCFTFVDFCQSGLGSMANRPKKQNWLITKL